MKFNEYEMDEVAQGFHYNNDPIEEIKEETYIGEEKYYEGEVKETYNINYEFPNKKKIIVIRKPVQLASKNSKFKTTEEYIEYYKKEFKNIRLAEDSKNMEKTYNHWNTIMSLLPKESELGKEKRLLKEQNYRDQKLKDSIKSHEKYVKLCFKIQNKTQRILKQKNEVKIKSDDDYTNEWINDVFILSMKENKKIEEKTKTKFEIKITVNKQLIKENKQLIKENKKIEENEGWELVTTKYKKPNMYSTKTKMCSSLNFGQCKHNICKFAHTLEELTPVECSFLDKCKKGDKCRFFHPSENKRDYCIRNSIIFEMIQHDKEMICLPPTQEKISPPQKNVNNLNNLQPPQEKISPPQNVMKLYKWNNLQLPNYPPLPQEEYTLPQEEYTLPQEEYTLPQEDYTLPQEDNGLCMYISAPFNIKSKVCLSLKIGQPCKYGTKCNFSHTLEELTPNKCLFEFCNNGNNCTYIHQNESKDDFCLRNSIVFNNDWNLVKSKVVSIKSNKKTRMCSYIMSGQECKHSICNFAHRLEELSPIECSFKNNCTKGNMCKFFHPNENKNDYCKRVN